MTGQAHDVVQGWVGGWVGGGGYWTNFPCSVIFINFQHCEYFCEIKNLAYREINKQSFVR